MEKNKSNSVEIRNNSIGFCNNNNRRVSAAQWPRSMGNIGKKVNKYANKDCRLGSVHTFGVGTVHSVSNKLTVKKNTLNHRFPCSSKNNKSNFNCKSKNYNSKIIVYQTNTRSVRNKFQELRALAVLHDFDIICITESWVSEKFNKDLLSEYELQGYKYYLYQRENRQGGGVILYIKESFTVKNVHGVKENSHVESVWLDISTNYDLYLRVGLFYRSPDVAVSSKRRLAIANYPTLI